MSGYRWAMNTLISKSALNASSAYLLDQFPLQSDQVTPAMKWLPYPQRKGTLRPKRARYVVNAESQQKGDGFYKLAWSIPFMTPGMYAYILANQFPSGADSGPATIQTWDDRIQDYSAFQVVVQLPVPGQDFQIVDDDYQDVIYRFDGGVLIT